MDEKHSSKQFLGILTRSFIATILLWPILEIALSLLGLPGSQGDYAALIPFAIFFNWPIVLVACVVVTLVLYNLEQTKNKTYLYQIIPAIFLMIFFRILSVI